MKTEINLNRYFERIAYDGPRAASLEVLTELHLLHPRAIPFENLNPFLGIPVLLDAKSLQRKLIDENRGGYCFEQNLLLMHVLKALGFKVKGMAARVLWNTPEGKVTPRGHMLLLVEAEGKSYLADVGFGGLVSTAPLLLEPDIEQETPHESFRLTRVGEEYAVYAKVKHAWKSLYQFNLAEHFYEDYDVTSWYLSNHPQSHFVTGLIAARPEVDPQRRYTLQGNRFSIHQLHRDTERQLLQTPAEIRQVLEQFFRIRLPHDSGLEQKLARLIKEREEEMA